MTLGALLAVAATGAVAAQDVRVDYPKMIIRVPAAGGLPPALSIAPTAYLPADALDTAQRREGQIRGRIFDRQPLQRLNLTTPLGIAAH